MALKIRKVGQKPKGRKKEKSRNITLSAYKASFLIDLPDMSFEELLGQLSELEGNHGERTFTNEFNNNSTTISRFNKHPQNDGVGVTLGTYVIGQDKSTLNFTTSDKELTPDNISSPKGHEFLDANVSLFASDNIVIFASLGGKKSQVESALNRIAMAAGLIQSTNMVSFAKVAASGPLNRIRASGVKFVEFDATTFLGRASEKTTSQTFNTAFGSNVLNQSSIKTRRENSAKLRIRSKSKYSKSMTLEAIEQDRNEWLDSVGVAAVQEDAIESYTIKLNDGSKIKSGELHLQKSVKIQADSSTYSIDEAHKALVSYYQEIVSDALGKN
jgi:hypothetical protein